MALARPAPAQPVSAVAGGQLQIQGTQLTVYADSLTNDADRTVNVGESVGVRTCFGGVCGSAAAGDPRVAGLKVKAELRGPELPRPISYETVPGGTFVLPGFQREGDYFLENIRLVETGSGRVLGESQPSVAVLHVAQILLQSATVTTLSLEDLKARGITLTQENFKAFKFAVGFAFGSTEVQFELPVLYQGNGQVGALQRAAPKLDGLPADVAHAIRRWEPPNLVPFVLEGSSSHLDIQEAGDPEDPEVPLFGAIVIPGTVSFLNQFFDARLIVANGAPVGSNANLANVTGALRLPSGEVLRLGGGIQQGQKIPVGNGAPIVPQQQGTASWTVEGVRSGHHVLTIDILADLLRPGRDPFPMGGKALAAVEVVDPRFNLTFNHPDTVREGEAYTLYVTVSNLSPTAQNLVTVDLSEHLVGATAAPSTNLRQTIETIAPGDASTLEFRLVSGITGKCFASTFQSEGPAVEGTIKLYAGVSEQGIPLSPATLLLPRFADRLPQSLLTADLRLLGLAYSLAIAPAGAAPAGLPHVVRADVERRAIDLGEAGQRLFLKDSLLPSAEALLLDQLGNRHDLSEYDALRRALDKGRLASRALGDLLRDEQTAQSLSAVGLLDHLATTMSYARPFVAVTLAAAGSALPTLELRAIGPAGTTFLAYTTDDTGVTPLRSLPYGEIYSVSDQATGAARAPLAVVGRLDPATSYRVLLHAPASGASAGRLVLIVPNAARDGFRKVDFGSVAMAPGEVYEVVAASASSDAPTVFTMVHAGTTTPVAGVPTPSPLAVAIPPFRLIGAVQDFALDRYGLGVSYLFNRPPDKTSAETAATYRVRTTFHGLDTSAAAQVFDRVSDKNGAAAFLQPSERVVDVRFAGPISPLDGVYAGSPILRHDHLTDTARLRDPRGIELDAALPAVTLEADHQGGLVDGKVLRGTGDPVEGARVQLIRVRESSGGFGDPIYDLVSEVTTGADGAFYFDFVEEPTPRQVDDTKILPGYQLRAIVPAGADPAQEPEEREEVSSVIRLTNRLAHLNIALLGRGTVTGHLLYQDDSSPVTGGTVTASSTLFFEQKKATVGADGSFRLAGVPVGPLTLTGRDSAGNRAYATIGLDQPGQTRDVTLRLPRSAAPKTGTVVGRVMRQRSGSPLPPAEPAAGALVAVYANGAALDQKTAAADGSFRFDKVPEGHVTVQAADFSVSRTPVVADTTLSADQVATVTLTIAEARPRAVTGRVVFHDGATNTDVPIAGAAAFISGPGVFAYTDAAGTYRIENVPVQGASDPAYEVTAIDFVRKLQGKTTLPPVVDAADGAPLVAATITLAQMTGGIDGTVVDPFGNPVRSGVGVVLYPLKETITDASGRFHFDDVPLGTYRLVAHDGDGLAPGKVGAFGAVDGVQIVFGGHRPAAVIRLVGGGLVRLHARTATTTGVLTPVVVTRTRYADAQKDLGSVVTQTTTDQDGRLEIAVPVGSFIAKAAHPINGTKQVGGTIAYPGQVLEYEIVFDGASSVTGTVLDVDGVTPVPDIDVALSASGFAPQHVTTDTLGRFTYALVTPGGVSVTTAGRIGAVDRVGRADGSVRPGQNLDLTVVMRKQGTVRGRIVEGGSPLPNAKYYVIESGYPNRRLPAGTALFTAGAQGDYEVAHVFEGPVTVVAQDPGQPALQGRAAADITADFQVVTVPDVVISAAVGTLGITVRDPQTGLPVPDCQITLSNGEMTVADGDGLASFDALPLTTYDISAFHAPTGRGGVVRNQVLGTAGQLLAVTILLDTRGSITGTLYDDAARTTKVGGGTIRLTGNVNGKVWGTSFTALATTDSDAATLGRFGFDGMPVGQYTLTAGIPSSNRIGTAQTPLTSTAPVVDLAISLEPAGDVSARVFEKLRSGYKELDPSTGVFAVRLRQPAGCVGPDCAYEYTLLAPTVPAPSHRYTFPNVLTSRSYRIDAVETSAEQRQGSELVGGTGSTADPYRVALGAKGILAITVKDAVGTAIAGANVTVSRGSFVAQTATDAAGQVNVYAVPAGSITVSARSSGGLGGSTTATLTYDDDVIPVSVTMAPSVSARGIVYHPPDGDTWDGNTASLVPEAAAVLQLRDSANQLHVVTTGSDGRYRFDGLPVGSYTVDATANDDQARASAAGSLSGPNGNENLLPDLILDAAPPRILSITPPSGAAGVSRRAVVEIVFSERLHPAVLPSGASSSYFAVRTPSGALATGSWASATDALGRSVVRFTPSVSYLNQTTYSVVVTGGSTGVYDLAQRFLTSSGNVGSSFTTSDTDGPTVAATVPDLTRPVDPQATLRFDFNEVVTATASELDGDLVGDAGELYYQTTSGGWTRLSPGSLYLTRGGYSLAIQPPSGVTLADATLRRRVVVTRLKDVMGNVMTDFTRDFSLYDQSPPVLAIGFPASAPGGQLSKGTSYTLTPSLTDGGVPATDIDRVEYFLASAIDPDQPATTPVYTATSAGTGYSFTFTPAYNGNGVDPQPLSIWVQGVDTSTNRSNVVRLAMNVYPNVPPILGAVTAAATAPVAGTFYAGSTIAGTVASLSDPDGSTVTLTAELRKENLANPNDPADLVGAPQSRPLTKPGSANGWADLPAQVFSFTVPVTTPEGTRLLVRAKATDSQGASPSPKESAAFALAHDPVAPAVDQVVAHVSSSATPATTFYLGQRFVIDFRARDTETAVKTVSVSFDGVFSSPVTATVLNAAAGTYRTTQLTVPASGIPSAGVTVVATVSALDHGGNTGTATTSFVVKPTSDPTVPTVSWLAPVEGGTWPAGYTSVRSAQGVAVLLRVQAADRDVDAGGNDIPGNIVSVRMRGPADATGALSSTWTLAVLASGSTASGVYDVLAYVPNAIPAGTVAHFEAEVTDAGGNVVTQPLDLPAVTPRQVWEGVTTSVLAATPVPGNEADPVYLLDGSTLSLYPQTSGLPRRFGSILLYSGAEPGTAGAVNVHSNVLTSPEVSSYASTTTYYPLDLEITQLLGVSSGSALKAKGLLGGTAANPSVALPSETSAGLRAGGSHGGSGGVGSGAPGSATDSVREPKLPGGGGGGNGTLAGGTGGGVVHVLGGTTATLVLHGEIDVDGESRANDLLGGGAGGAVRIVAREVKGTGRVHANGGSSSNAASTGAGGGGRIAISVVDPASGALPVTLEALGGWNSPSSAAATEAGGAGTIWIERRDASGTPVAPGTLEVTNRPGKPASTTPLPALSGITNGTVTDAALTAVDAANGKLTFTAPLARGAVDGETLVLFQDDPTPANQRTWLVPVQSQERLTATSVLLTVQTTPTTLGDLSAALAAGKSVTAHARSAFSTISLTGAARLVADDDLAVGASLNDRASVTADATSRLLLRGEQPQLTVSSTPVPGTISQGTALSVTWSGSDLLGFVKAETTWSIAGTTVTTPYPNEPTTVTQGASPVALTVPASQPAGTVSYTVKLTDRAGRTRQVAQTWTVVADTTAPVVGAVQLVPAPGAGETYTGGDVVTITGTATDDVALAQLSITVDGVTTTSATSPVSRVWAAPPVSSDTSYVITVTATDLAGNVGTSSRTVTVKPNSNPNAPNVSITCPNSLTHVPSGYAGFTLTALATDDQGVVKVEFYAPNATTPFSTKTPATPTTPYSIVSDAIALPTVTADAIVRYKVRAYDAANQVREAAVDVHVVPAVALAAAGNDWAALATQTAYVPAGTTVVIDGPRTLAGLLVLNGGTVTHSAGASMDLTASGLLEVHCGGTVSADGKGYANGASYPGLAQGSAQNAGGSHIGSGGASTLGQAGSSYGSVTQPREAGAGGAPGGAGGGVIRLAAESVSIDGAVRANGVTNPITGAGGSVSVTASTLSGTGSIEAKGSSTPNGSWGGGGGGAIAISYQAGTIPAVLSAGGGSGAFRNGGAGTIWVKGPGATFGSLAIANGGLSGPATALPSLGSGTVSAITGNVATLDRPAIPAFFVGHWIEVSTGSVMKGTWRVAAVSGSDVTFETTPQNPLVAAAGDHWQGVYRVDTLSVPDGDPIADGDPIRIGVNGITALDGPATPGKVLALPWAVSGSAVTVSGNVSVPSITATTLTVTPGATLSHPAFWAGGSGLLLSVADTLTIQSGGKIDATGLGYGQWSTYPGATLSGRNSGGSHIGPGGVVGIPAGEAYGSLRRPMEPGAGGRSGGAGGGAVRIVAGTLSMTGSALIRANGTGTSAAAGAGGSVWVTATSIVGNLTAGGGVEASGGDSANGNGGGGAVSVQYSGSATGNLLSSLRARGGVGTGVKGSAGTVYVEAPGSTYGVLTVSNGGSGAGSALPSFGSGAISALPQPGVVSLDRFGWVPPYLAGEWIEVLGPAGQSRGIWRVGDVVNPAPTVSIPVNGYGAQDGAVYAGHVIYIQETIGQRFPSSGIDLSWLSQNHFILARLNGAQWELDNNSSFVPFAPLSTDRVVASFSKSGSVWSVAKATCPGLACGSIGGVQVQEPARLRIDPNTTGGGDENDGEIAFLDFQLTNQPPRLVLEGDTSPIAPGDSWQHVYRFDSLVAADPATCPDPIREGANGLSTLVGPSTGTLELARPLSAARAILSGSVAASQVLVTDLTIGAGARLSGAAATGAIALTVPGVLTIQDGGSLSTTGQGYSGRTDPAADLPGANSGGSHIGLGALGTAPAGTVFGNPLLPGEAGSAGRSGGAGGGVIRLTVGNLVLNGSGNVSADGVFSGGSGGAGGSVWVTATSLTGNSLNAAAGGGIHANGGGAVSGAGGGGGGGAVVVEYQSASGGLPSAVTARGGVVGSARGGAGSVLLKGPGATSGTLVIDAGGSPSAATALPAMGGGTISSVGGSGGFSSDTRVWLPRYLVGREVEVTTSGGTLRGTYRVASVSNAPSTIDVPYDVQVDTNDGDSYSGGGYLLYSDLTLSAHFPGSAEPGFEGSHFFAARYAAGAWQYDNNGAFVTFTPDATDRVIATFTKDANGIATVTRMACPALCGSVNGIPVAALARGQVLPNTVYGFGANPHEMLITTPALVTEPGTITLEGASTLAVGDQWQAVYRLDAVNVVSGGPLQSADPIRLPGGDVSLVGPASGPPLEVTQPVVGTRVTVSGNVAVPSITATDVTIKAGAKLQLAAVAAATHSLTVSATGQLVIEDGASIDVTGKGFAASETEPTADWPGTNSGGSHLGVGSLGTAPAGATFDNARTPMLPGGGGNGGGAGGGALRIVAGALSMTGSASIAADGAFAGTTSGAGGSVWITANALSGSVTVGSNGSIHANGGTAATGTGAGGGGAVTIEYQSSSGNIHASAVAKGGVVSTLKGGPGTVLLSGPGSTDGSLKVDNGGGAATATAILPAIGSGAVTAVPQAATYSPDNRLWLSSEVVGRFVEISAVDGTLKGAYRIASVSNAASTIEMSSDVEIDTSDTVSYSGYLLYSGLTQAQHFGASGASAASRFFAARYNVDHWEYDNDAGVFTTFVPDTSDRVFASFTKNASGFTGISRLVCTGAPCGSVSGVPIIAVARGLIYPNTAAGGAANAHEVLIRSLALASEPGAITLEGNPSLSIGDRWQGIYRFDDLSVLSGSLISADPIRLPSVGGVTTVSGPASGSGTLQLPSIQVTGDVVVQGSVSTSSITAANLTVASGAVLTHPKGTATGTTGLSIAVTGLARIAGAIDVTGRGYPAGSSGATPPPVGSGGSHIGQGGVGTTAGATFGSVLRPQEPGGGAAAAAAGGGVVTLSAASLLLEGGAYLKADGEWVPSNGGAGGSIWVTCADLNANGWTGGISANGGGAISGTGPGGGGGAISIAYASVAGSLAGRLVAQGGLVSTTASARNGGPGSVVVKGPGQAFENLLVDNLTVPGGSPTVLPSLGSGVAAAGTGSDKLETGLSSIPQWLRGHWVEVRTAGRVVKGTWRIGTDASAIVGGRVTLVPNGSETISLATGDLWQGVYRFESASSKTGVLTSVDPIYVLGSAGLIDLTGPPANLATPTFLEVQPLSGTSVTVRGAVSTPAITASSLLVASGGKLTHPLPVGGVPSRLVVDVSGTVTVTGSIDVRGRGYQGTASYPATIASSSHLGQGASGGATYGSVARPSEAGSASTGTNAGAGVVFISSGALQVDGSIVATAANGSGGSIWIQTGAVSGTGSIEASCDSGTGGGGAVSVQYSSGSLPALKAKGGPSGGAPGTLYTRGPAPAVHGSFTVDNGTITPSATLKTVLPALGFGTATTGTGGATVVTTRSANIPAYFAGHWVEIRSGTVLKGTWRIGTGPSDISGKTFVLVPNQGEPIDVQPGDSWQGVYRFDTVSAPNGDSIVSSDPIRILGFDGVVALVGPTATNRDLEINSPIVGTDVSVTGNVTVPSISATTLVVKSGGRLAHPTGAGPLSIDLTGSLVVEAGGSINVSDRGYSGGVTYPGATGGGIGSGGSHIGRGPLVTSPQGSTFGSVYRPLEMGGSSQPRPLTGTPRDSLGPEPLSLVSTGLPSGGAVSIQAGSVTVEGSVLANGVTVAPGNAGGGAGGSVWIRTTGSLSGNGTIEARGGSTTSTSLYAGGGGGAVAVEYGSVSGGILGTIHAQGGTGGGTRHGGAGSIYLRGPFPAQYGDLIIDNANIAGAPTDLASFGSGTVGATRTDGVLVTGLGSVAGYFRGHYVEIRDSSNILKGTWRIGTGPNDIAGGNVTLVPNGTETISLTTTDTWRGVYKFDNPITVRNGAVLTPPADPVTAAPAGEPGTLGARTARDEEAPLVEEAPEPADPHSEPTATARFTCPSAGDAAVPGVDLYLEVAVERMGTEDKAPRVELFLDGSTLPFASGVPAGGVFTSTFRIPENLRDGETLRLVARVTDGAGRYRETRLPLRVTTGLFVDGPGTLDLRSLRTGDTLIVRSGEVLATGEASLDRLVVLGGARFAAAPGARPRVGAARVSVGCGGELDLVSPALPAALPAAVPDVSEVNR